MDRLTLIQDGYLRSGPSKNPDENEIKIKIFVRIGRIKFRFHSFLFNNII